MTFSFSAADDAAYALGWPHVRRIEPGTDTRSGDVSFARELLRDVDPHWIPRRTQVMCLAIVRAFDVTPSVDPPEALARMSSTDPLDDAEVDESIDRWLARGCYWFQIEELVFALEALLGGERAGPRLVARIAQTRPMKPKDWDMRAFFGNARTRSPEAALFCLGFVALRSPATRAALASLQANVTGTQRSVLDLVLDGADGCRRHGVSHLFGASFAGDDPAYLAELSERERLHSSLTPRFPYLGGETVLADYVARAEAGIPPHLSIRFVQEFGTIRHPLTIEIMGALAARNTPGPFAIAWLCEHADFVAEHPAARARLSDAVRAILDGEVAK